MGMPWLPRRIQVRDAARQDRRSGRESHQDGLPPLRPLCCAASHCWQLGAFHGSKSVPFNPWRRLCTPRTEQQAAGRLSVIAQQRVRPSGGLHPLLRHPKRQIHVSTA